MVFDGQPMAPFAESDGSIPDPGPAWRPGMPAWHKQFAPRFARTMPRPRRPAIGRPGLGGLAALSLGRPGSAAEAGARMGQKNISKTHQAPQVPLAVEQDNDPNDNASYPLTVVTTVPGSARTSPGGYCGIHPGLD